MRFKRYESFSFEWTPRKEACLLRKQMREREALPLFAELVQADQPTVEQERSRRAELWDRTQRQERDRRAKSWRAVRARLALIPAKDRAQVLAYWNGHRGFPGDPSYLSYVVRQYEQGGLAALGEC